MAAPRVAAARVRATRVAYLKDRNPDVTRGQKRVGLRQWKNRLPCLCSHYGGIAPLGVMSPFHHLQEMHMTKRLSAALTAAALCSMVGALHAQSMTTTDAPDPTGQERYQQPSGTPPSEPSDTGPAMRAPAVAPSNEAGAIVDQGSAPVSRSDTQKETRAAMRANQIPRGELSTPDQDKGGERALTPTERGMPGE